MRFVYTTIFVLTAVALFITSDWSLTQNHHIKLNKAKIAYDQGDLVEAKNILTTGADDEASIRSRISYYSKLIQYCGRSYDYVCLVETFNKILELQETKKWETWRQTAKSSEISELAYVINYADILTYLLAEDHKAIDQEFGYDFAAKVGNLEVSFFGIKYQLLASELYWIRGDYRSSNDALQRAISGLFFLPVEESHKSAIADLLAQIIQQMAANSDPVRAHTWLSIAGTFVSANLSSSGLEYAIWKNAAADIFSTYGLLEQAGKSLEQSLTVQNQLKMENAMKVAMLSTTSSALTFFHVQAGELDNAETVIRAHILAPQKEKIIEAGKFSNQLEMQYALAVLLVKHLGKTKPDTRWVELFDNKPTWISERPNASDQLHMEAQWHFGRFLLGSLLNQEGANEQLIQAINKDRLSMEMIFRSSNDVFPMPTLESRAMLSAGLSLARRENDSELMFLISELLNRRPESGQAASADELFLLASQPNANVRGWMQSRLNLRSLQQKVEISNLRTLISRYSSIPLADDRVDSSEQSKSIKQGIGSFVQKNREIDSHIVRSNARHSSTNRTPSLSEVRKFLRPNEVLLTMLQSSESDWIRICVTSDDANSSEFKFDPTELSSDVKLLLLALSGTHAPSDVLDSQYPIASAVRIGNLLTQGIEQCTGGIRKQIVFVQHKSFAGLPLSALLQNAPPKLQYGHDLSQASWLAKDFDFSYVSSISSFVAARRLSSNVLGTESYLGIGDPSFKAPLPAGSQPDGAKHGKFHDALISQEAAATFSELPATGTEIVEVARNFSPVSQTILLKNKATEENFRLQSLGDYGVIHFATHGLLAEDINGLVEPALLLKRTHTTDPTRDGLLQASEIAALQLNARLAVLSACNTANYQLREFGSNLRNLSDAFMLAGVSDVSAYGTDCVT